MLKRFFQICLPQTKAHCTCIKVKEKTLSEIFKTIPKSDPSPVSKRLLVAKALFL
jgi:hypothetical protein